ncbi:MAG TPA: thioredoxin-like domain-containing protein [Nitrososphaera sp.]|nr:thioredoxin-like domain-containing protein [Nitrososphaera sp.]
MFGLPSLNNSKAKDFPKDFVWLNTDRPLSLEDLRGYVVILDFWTYCCINCMHTLPDLEWIEKKYHGKPVVVIGVHSAKFYNEQEAENVREAIGRYEISHPVIVDRNMEIWESYGVSGWPTLVVIDPKGNVIYQQSGEGQRENLDDVISVLLERNKEILAKEPIVIKRPAAPSTRTLSYPGKLSLSPSGKMLAVSDSNHNRILVIDVSSGKIIYKIGSGTKGLRDGTFEQARFFRPQGVLWVAEEIYVADTENHALREINLKSGTVKTLAGDGKQGYWVQSTQDARVTRLSSPWDLAYDRGFIFIAMAGLHQIWTYHIETNKIGPFAGSGYENIVDGQLERAQFAQPSGLSISGRYLFVADSEVSAVRRIDLDSKTVETVVGEGLFIFGHSDGPLDSARLQHPLGVACGDGRIYVADTYNHAIRLVDLIEKKVSTLVGRPETKAVCNINDPSCDTLGLYEPSDVKVHGNTLYISDTNNHLIRIYDLEKNVLKTLTVRE